MILIVFTCRDEASTSSAKVGHTPPQQPAPQGDVCEATLPGKETTKPVEKTANDKALSVKDMAFDDGTAEAPKPIFPK